MIYYSITVPMLVIGKYTNFLHILSVALVILYENETLAVRFRTLS